MLTLRDAIHAKKVTKKENNQLRIEFAVNCALQRHDTNTRKNKKALANFENILGEYGEYEFTLRLDQETTGHLPALKRVFGFMPTMPDEVTVEDVKLSRGFLGNKKMYLNQKYNLDVVKTNFVDGYEEGYQDDEGVFAQSLRTSLWTGGIGFAAGNTLLATIGRSLASNSDAPSLAFVAFCTAAGAFVEVKKMYASYHEVTFKLTEIPEFKKYAMALEKIPAASIGAPIAIGSRNPHVSDPLNQFALEHLPAQKLETTIPTKVTVEIKPAI